MYIISIVRNIAKRESKVMEWIILSQMHVHHGDPLFAMQGLRKFAMEISNGNFAETWHP